MRLTTTYDRRENAYIDENNDASYTLCTESASNKKGINLKGKIFLTSAPMKSFQYIEMPIEMNKKDPLYINFIKELNQKYLPKHEGQEIDVVEILSQKNIELDKLLNEEFISIGIFIEKILVKDQIYLLIANYMKGFNLIKIHANDFFNESCLTKNKIIVLTNAILKAVYHPNERIVFSLYKPTQNFKDHSKLILSLETSNYTSLKILQNTKYKSIDNINVDLVKTLTNNIQNNNAYDEEQRKNIIKEL